MKTLYETDFHAWSLDQASHLKKKEFNMLDFDHLIEEIETLGISDQNALKSHIANILTHLLKKRYQPQYWTKSWTDSIEAARAEAKFVLKKNPSFSRFLPEFLPLSYKISRVRAFKETGLETDTFPKECPWTIDEVLGE